MEEIEDKDEDQKKKTRKDVIAKRVTKAASGTPVVNKRKVAEISGDCQSGEYVYFIRICILMTSHPSSGTRTKSKKKAVGEDGINEDWNTTMKVRVQRKKLKASSARNDDDDDSMFQYGGFIGDDETDQVEAQAMKPNQTRAAKASGAYVEFPSHSYMAQLIHVVDDQGRGKP